MFESLRILPTEPSAWVEVGVWARIPPGPSIPPPPGSVVRLTRPPRPAGEPEDEALVSAALAGDKPAERAIWRRYSPLVRARLRRSMPSEDVEDCVQEVFLRLFRFLPYLRDPAALRSFIFGIAVRVAGSELRHRRSRPWLALTTDGELPETASQADDVEMRETVSRVLAIVKTLTPASHRFFTLRFVEERELAEIAAAMNVSLATTKRRLARIAAHVRILASQRPALARRKAA